MILITIDIEIRSIYYISQIIYNDSDKNVAQANWSTCNINGTGTYWHPYSNYFPFSQCIYSIFHWTENHTPPISLSVRSYQVVTTILPKRRESVGRNAYIKQVQTRPRAPRPWRLYKFSLFFTIFLHFTCVLSMFMKFEPSSQHALFIFSKW